MKTSILTLLAIASFVLQSSCAGTETEIANEEIIFQLLASNNVQTAISILPDIEKLWPQQPEAYFQSSKKAASVLGRVADNSEAKLALLKLFTKVIEKPLPTNGDLAVPCLQEKDGVILYYFNFEEVRSDKSRWVAIAKYIGEVRAQIIPTFVPKTVYLNLPIMWGSSTQSVQQAIQENEQNKAINNYQQSLRTENRTLTFQLIHNCARVSAVDPQKTDFIKDIAFAAHLTDDEQNQLR